MSKNLEKKLALTLDESVALVGTYTKTALTIASGEAKEVVKTIDGKEYNVPVQDAKLLAILDTAKVVQGEYRGSVLTEASNALKAALQLRGVVLNELIVANYDKATNDARSAVHRALLAGNKEKKLMSLATSYCVSRKNTAQVTEKDIKPLFQLVERYGQRLAQADFETEKATATREGTTPPRKAHVFKLWSGNGSEDAVLKDFNLVRSAAKVEVSPAIVQRVNEALAPVFELACKDVPAKGSQDNDTFASIIVALVRDYADVLRESAKSAKSA